MQVIYTLPAGAAYGNISGTKDLCPGVDNTPSTELQNIILFRKKKRLESCAFVTTSQICPED